MWEVEIRSDSAAGIKDAARWVAEQIELGIQTNEETGGRWPWYARFEKSQLRPESSGKEAAK